MADLTITVTDVFKGSGASTETGTAGEAITAGKALRKDPTTGNLLLADSNVDDNTATVVGIALHAAALNQPITYQTGGTITLGNVLTAGKIFVLSATPGGIAPVADLVTGWRTSIIGYAISTTQLKILLNNTKITN